MTRRTAAQGRCSRCLLATQGAANGASDEGSEAAMEARRGWAVAGQASGTQLKPVVAAGGGSRGCQPGTASCGHPFSCCPRAGWSGGRLGRPGMLPKTCMAATVAAEAGWRPCSSCAPHLLPCAPSGIVMYSELFCGTHSTYTSATEAAVPPLPPPTALPALMGDRPRGAASVPAPDSRRAPAARGDAMPSIRAGMYDCRRVVAAAQRAVGAWAAGGESAAAVGGWGLAGGGLPPTAG